MKLRLKVTLQLRDGIVLAGTVLSDEDGPFPHYVNEEALSTDRYFEILDPEPTVHKTEEEIPPKAKKAGGLVKRK